MHSTMTAKARQTAISSVTTVLGQRYPGKTWTDSPTGGKGEIRFQFAAPEDARPVEGAPVSDSATA